MNIKSYYKTLGIEYPSTRDEIKKAFHKLAHIHHPDKGGDEAKFKEINHAYQILMKEGHWNVLAQEYARENDTNFEDLWNEFRKAYRNFDPEEQTMYKDYGSSRGGRSGEKNEPRIKIKREIFCTDDGTGYWTEDYDGFVVSFWGKIPEDEDDEPAYEESTVVEALGTAKLSHHE